MRWSRTEIGWLAWTLVAGMSCAEEGRSLGPDAADAAATADTGAIADAVVDAALDAATDAAGAVPLPLESMSRADAVALAGFARRLRVASAADPVSSPVAWAMVNISCADRAMALQFALATALAPSPPEIPLLDSGRLTTAEIFRLRGIAEHKVGTINITGPLVTHQTLILPDGSEAEMATPFYYWPYHHGVVVNVDGEPSVLDLSTGDEPLPVETWIRAFVVPEVDCPLLPVDAYDAVWIYWLNAFGNTIPPPRPAADCGYTLSPLFTMEVDQEIPTDFIIAAADEMRVQTGSLRTVLAESGVTLDEEQLPFVVSRYDSLPEDAVCDALRFNYCDLR